MEAPYSPLAFCPADTTCPKLTSCRISWVASLGMYPSWRPPSVCTRTACGSCGFSGSFTSATPCAASNAATASCRPSKLTPTTLKRSCGHVSASSARRRSGEARLALAAADDGDDDAPRAEQRVFSAGPRSASSSSPAVHAISPLRIGNALLPADGIRPRTGSPPRCWRTVGAASGWLLTDWSRRGAPSRGVHTASPSLPAPADAVDSGAQARR
mmetsp:Transcript_39705/g.100687  ORF Transcript_39705/g.100687 Transcript_39705/m.100687 type:complete len:214 (-) Transcript_39705:13-654(-)